MAALLSQTTPSFVRVYRRGLTQGGGLLHSEQSGPQSDQQGDQSKHQSDPHSSQQNEPPSGPSDRATSKVG